MAVCIRSFNRTPQSKSMHIIPRGHIETNSSTSSYFDTLSLEYPRGPKSKSMHIMPRGHIETDPYTSSYFVTLSLEYPKGEKSRMNFEQVFLGGTSTKQGLISKTQRSAAGEDQTRDASIPSQALLPLNHCAPHSGWILT